MTRLLAICAAATMALLSHTATADDLAITNLMGKVPTEHEIIQGLITPTGLRIERSTNDTNAATPAEPQETLGAIALEIQFEFDSAQLTPSARQVLEALGQALGSSELASYSFLVEGHTDSVGSGTYNQDLSERRAYAVQDFLSREYGIPSPKLSVVGRGEQSPLDTNDPENGRNRRVQIVNLGQ